MPHYSWTMWIGSTIGLNLKNMMIDDVVGELGKFYLMHVAPQDEKGNTITIFYSMPLETYIFQESIITAGHKIESNLFPRIFRSRNITRNCTTSEKYDSL